MKLKIHPQYNQTIITCACGNVLHTSSTRKNIKVEVCSACHPFFTGKQKLVDSAGRVEKFKTRFKHTGGKTVRRKPKVAKKAIKYSKGRIAKKKAPEKPKKIKKKE